MTLYKWSQTAGNNASADSTINWAEGQVPSSINDSARAMMASLAKYRDDTCGGGLGTGGTATAYTLASNQVFDSTAHMAAQELTVYFHATSGANPTLNVDNLGAFPIVTDGAGTPVPSGTLIAGTPYELTFVNTSSHFRLKNFFVVPYVMPIGAVMEFYGFSVPNGNFAFPNGQAISRTTYAALFALIGTTYGTGDGSTTFNLPDLTGRVTAMKEAIASRLTASYFGGNSTVLGSVGGSEAHILSAGEIPSITSADVNTISVLSASTNVVSGNLGNTTAGNSGPITVFNPGQATAGQLSSSGNNTISVTSSNTGGAAHTNVQHTIICNKIMRII
ncbi:phage tail protein [Bradyrhizobium sp. 18BD]